MQAEEYVTETLRSIKIVGDGKYTKLCFGMDGRQISR